jgi:type VI protein secretion system component VasK
VIVLIVGRALITLATVAIVVWVLLVRRRRPDVIPTWLAVKIVAICVALSAAAPVRFLSLGNPLASAAERWIVLATGAIFAWVAVRLWTVRRGLTHIPSLADLDAAKDAERVAMARLGDMEREVARLRDRVVTIDAQNRSGWQAEATAAGWTPPSWRRA